MQDGSRHKIKRSPFNQLVSWPRCARPSIPASPLDNLWKFSRSVMLTTRIENPKKTRSSILCVTHQVSRKKRNYSVGWTVPYEMMNNKWYLIVLGQYMTNDDTGWYLVSISWYCLVSGGTGSGRGLYACMYIFEKSVGLVGLIPMPHTLNHRQQCYPACIKYCV